MDDIFDDASDREEMLLNYSNAAFARLTKIGYEKLNRVDQIFVCIWTFEAEVNNGGFDQYYFNSAGDLAFETLDALHTVGASTTASILHRGNKLFGDNGPSTDWTTRQHQLDALPESNQEMLDTLDEEFYRYPDDLSVLMAKYLVKNGALDTN